MLAILYGQRNAVERLFRWTKGHQWIASRFEKLADAYLRYGVFDLDQLVAQSLILRHTFECNLSHDDNKLSSSFSSNLKF